MTPSAVASIAASAVVFGLGWWVGSEINQGKHDAALASQQEAQTETAQVIAKRLAEMSTAQAKITERVTHEVQTNTVYRDCVLPDDGRRLLNDAISGSDTSGGEPVQGAAD